MLDKAHGDGRLRWKGKGIRENGEEVGELCRDGFGKMDMSIGSKAS